MAATNVKNMELRLYRQKPGVVVKKLSDFLSNKECQAIYHKWKLSVSLDDILIAECRVELSPYEDDDITTRPQWWVNMPDDVKILLLDAELEKYQRGSV